MGVAAWVPIVTFVGGSIVTVGIEYIRVLNSREDRRQTSEEAKADRDATRLERAEERHQRLSDEHRNEQRETLLELQEKLSDYLRSIGKAHNADQQAWSDAGEPAQYPVSLLPDGLSEEINVVQRRVQILSQRVDNDKVREEVSNLISAAAEMMLNRDAKSQRVLLTIAKSFESLNGLIGSALRTRPGV